MNRLLPTSLFITARIGEPQNDKNNDLKPIRTMKPPTQTRLRRATGLLTMALAFLNHANALGDKLFEGFRFHDAERLIL
jgi:hypothetical protein